MSHAKASSAGPAKHHLGRPALALSLFAVVLVALGLLAPAVGAAPKHPFKETFGSAAQPSFTQAQGMAVVQSSGDLLVIDAGAKTLSRFKANGEPRPFSALGTNVIDGKKGVGGKDCAEEPSSCDATPQEEVLGLFTGPREVQVAVDESGTATNGNIYLTNSFNGAIDIFASDGHYLGQLTETGASHFGEACGVAVDPNGAVYVSDYYVGIHKYVPTANPPLNTDNTKTFSVSEPCGLAAGIGPSAGSLFVTHWGGNVEARDASTGEPRYEGAVSSGTNNTVSVDPVSGHVFVAKGNGVEEYDASGSSPKLIGSASLPGEALGVAALGENLYASRSGSANVEVFGPPPVSTGNATQLPGSAVTLHGTVNPEGALVESCSFEYGETTAYGQVAPCAESPAQIGSGSIPISVHADVSGLKAGIAYNFRLIATLAGDRDEEGLDADFTVLGPRISNTAVHVTDTTARLDAQINPAGEETTYQLEYLSDADYQANGESFSGPQPASKVPVPAKSIGAGTEAVKVTEQVAGLSPQTTYHFRIVATNPGGIAIGPEEVLTTYSPPFVGLPDGRAYEQATPLAKNGSNINGRIGLVKAASNGDATTFYVPSLVPGGEGGQDFALYLASRSPAGWLSQGLHLPASTGPTNLIIGWSENLSDSYAWSLVSADHQILYQRDSATRALRPIAEGDLVFGGDLSYPAFVGASSDGATVIFETKAKLLPAAIEGKSNVYAWEKASGDLNLVSALNDSSSPPEGAFAGPYDWFIGNTTAEGGAADNYYTQASHVVSADGTSVYFTAAGSGRLYLRHNPTEAQSPLDGDGKCTDPALACTIEVSASKKKNGAGTDGRDLGGHRPAAFMAATPDGSKAFFTSPEKLTNDANTGSEAGPAIARVDLNGTTGLDLSFLPTAASGVEVDGSHIYWADPQAGTIGRADLDGSEVKEDFISGAGNPRYVAVDGSHIYWTDAAANTIGRAAIDGTDAKQDFITGASNPQGIDVDATYVYWANADFGSFGAVGRAKLDGSEVNQSFFEDAATGDLAVDANKIYFSRVLIYQGAGFGYIRSNNLDGSGDGIEDVTVNGAEVPPSIAVDGSHLYWANPTTGVIGRSNLDGSSREQNFVPVAGNRPGGLALDASHLYWSANQGKVVNVGNDLYRYDADSGELIDLSVDTVDVNGADVRAVLGVSDDGSHAYFVANSVLTDAANAEGESAAPGNCTGRKADPGTCNLYLWHDGDVTFVARLDAKRDVLGDAPNWRPVSFDKSGVLERTARVSADGTLLFRSQRRLTPYDNVGPACGIKAGGVSTPVPGPCPELYRYNTDEGLSCVSCNPTGAAPVDPSSLQSITTQSGLEGPAPTILRNLSADGKRVFFETPDQLVANDVNGFAGCPSIEADGINSAIRTCQDVYEWVAKGTGSCDSDAQNGGCLYLLSIGTSPDPSYFADASASGNDAMIFTTQQLVSQDRDELTDIYDARVGGGIASQNPPPPPVPCEGEACKGGASIPPPSSSAGTATFSGPGNQKANHHQKKKKKKHAKKHKKKAKKHRQARAHR